MKEHIIYRKFYKKNKPFAAGIWTTDKCNLKCIHCFGHDAAEKELTTDELKDIITQLAQIDCMELRFTGGEPFCRKDLFEIMSFARQNNFTILLVTNGTKIANNNIKEIKTLKPEIFITLYAATKELHESISAVKGSFEETMKGIDLLEKNKIPFHIQTPIMKNNFSGLKDLYDLCKRRRWRLLTSYIIYPSLDHLKPYVDYRVTDDQLEYAAKNRLLYPSGALKTLFKKRKRFRIVDRLGLLFTSISTTGKVFASTMLRIEVGDLKKDSFSNIWFRSPKLNWIRSLKPLDFACSSCKHYHSCGWEPALALLEEGDLQLSPREWCRIHKWELEEVWVDGQK